MFPPRPMSTERLVTLTIRWLLLALAVWAASEIVGGIHVEGWGSTLAVALILGLLNVFIRPVLLFASLPATILTLGLFLVVLNAALLELTAWIADILGTPDFSIDSFGAALLGALIISLVGFAVRRLIKAERIARDLTGHHW
jgi:putative membrane protein